jgi:quinol monooxygenase YgiN
MKSLLLASLLLLGFSIPVQSVQAAEVRMYVRHEVNDYATWRKGYDAFNAERKKMGVTSAAVYRSVDNPNDVTVIHDFKSADKAKEFASSARLKEVMEKLA